MFRQTALSLIVSLFSLVVSFGLGDASYTYAAGALTLSDGQFENAPRESEEYRIIAQDLFTALTINVSENGEVSGEVQVPFSFDLNGDSYSGQASIRLNGTYDFDQRSIKGSFAYKHNRIKKHTFESGNVAELEGSRNIADDKFTGTADENMTRLQFSRIGNVTYSALPPEVKGKNDTDISDLPDVEYQPGVDTGARFASIQGEVEMYPDGDPDNRSFAKMDVKIEPGMHIFTGEDSNVILTFADMSTFKLPPNSEIVILSIKPKSQLSLIAGKIWGNIKKIANNETIEYETSQAVLGIKGTIFVLEATKDQSTVKVIEGTVSFKSKTSGKTEMVNSGETLIADGKGLGQKNVFKVEEENVRWDKLTGTEKKALGLNNYKYFAIGSAGLLALSVFVVWTFKRRKRLGV